MIAGKPQKLARGGKEPPFISPQTVLPETQDSCLTGKCLISNLYQSSMCQYLDSKFLVSRIERTHLCCFSTQFVVACLRALLGSRYRCLFWFSWQLCDYVSTSLSCKDTTVSEVILEL